MLIDDGVGSAEQYYDHGTDHHPSSNAPVPERRFFLLSYDCLTLSRFARQGLSLFVDRLSAECPVTWMLQL